MATAEYLQFIESKSLLASEVGINVDPSTLNPNLFPFQRWSVDRLLRMGRAALFASTGLGKTGMQLSWAEAVHNHTGKPVLIFAPLAVSKQSSRESKKFGVDIKYVESQDDVCNGLNITNYEKMHKFSSNENEWAGIVLDESSLLKNETGKFSQALTEFASTIPYRLACSATPAPNDFMEFGTHAEFLGVMTREEMLATFFTHDGGNTSQWRLKKHGKAEFWKWIASWASVYRLPSDIGFSDDGFILPPLVDCVHTVESQLEAKEGELFAWVGSMSDRRNARKSSIEDRVNKAVELAMSNSEPWMFWVEFNDEGDMLEKRLSELTPFVRQVAGRHTLEQKEQYMTEFADGDIRILISKPSICGTGMNWQHCRNVCFVGINDSWESMFQATNRFWRFGQTQQVNRHLIFSEHEWVVFSNLKRKQEQAESMWNESAKYLQTATTPTSRQLIDYKPIDSFELPDWLN